MNARMLPFTAKLCRVWSTSSEGDHRDIVKSLHHVPQGAGSCGQSMRRLRPLPCNPTWSDLPAERSSREMNPAVREVMNEEVIYLAETDTVRSAIQTFLNNGISGAPVKDCNGRLVGVLSESDMITRETGCRLEQLSGNEGSCSLPQNVSLFQQFIQDFKAEKLHMLLNSQVKEIMTSSPISVDPSSTIFLAAKKMVDHKINRLPVVEEDEVVGILTRGDLMQFMIWELLMAESPMIEQTGDVK